MIHPHTELRFINEQIGYGVFATRLIPRGTIIWVRDDFDRTFSAAQVANMTSIDRAWTVKYCFIDARGDFVLCWDLARYMNHSCDASCRGAGYNFEIAVRDIHPGEELTDDYGALNPECDFACLCDSARCRKTIHTDDLLRYVDSWDRIVADSFHLIPALPQPLWLLVKEKNEVEAVLSGRTPMASCRRNYYALPTAEEVSSVYSGSYSTLTDTMRANNRP